MATCLQTAQNAAAWLGLPIPSTLFGATDTQTIQLRSLLNEELIELRKWPDIYWQQLIQEHTFTTTATDQQPADAVPDDLDHFVDSSMWDRTLTRPVVGPISPQLWQAWKARPVLTSVVFGYIMMNNVMFTAPNPPAGDTVAYNYITKNCVYSAGSTTLDKEEFSADDDTTFFDSTMMARGLRWRFQLAKGLPYAQAYDEWFSLVQREASRSGGMATLSMAGSYSDWLAGPYIPQFNFPS